MTFVAAVVLAAVGAPHASARVAPPTCPAGSHPMTAGLRTSCLHEDLYDGRAQAPWVGVQPRTAPPVCYGDGQSGPRVQLIYGYPAGRPGTPQAVLKIQREIVPRMQAVIVAASQGKDLGIRFAFNAGCNGLSVPTLAFPSSVIATKDADTQMNKIVSFLQSQGFDAPDRKYQVIWDWWNSGPICGLGELADGDTPRPVSVQDGAPVRNPVVNPQYSAVWKAAFSPKGPNCWELDQSKAGGEVHELFHTLGAVQTSAPNSDGGGHCTDTPSVMCPVRGRATRPACAKVAVQVLDCGNDDYWNPNPATGSYLATHANIATSRYFGPQPEDRLPALS